MRFIFLIVTVLVLSACKKDIHEHSLSITGENISNDALAPLPCHVTYLATTYPNVPGKVPPFRVGKILYADTRVRTITTMTSRAYPNHPSYPNHGIETSGTFTYSPNAAKFAARKEILEYFKYPAGHAGEKGISVHYFPLNFKFNQAGVCTSVALGTRLIMALQYNNKRHPKSLSGFVYKPATGPEQVYKVDLDGNGNPIKIYCPANPNLPVVTYRYNYTRSGGRYFYLPSQYAINYEYNLLEVMQWLPPTKNPRSFVSVRFPVGNGKFVTQSQIYKNEQYDERKNLIGYSYGDNYTHEVHWHCK